MGPIILIAMIVVPIVEIGLFIEVGGWLGVLPTLAIVLLTAVAGTWLLRAQGLSTLARVQQSLDAGRLPVAEVFDGLCLLVAGALLLTPGFFTDAVGFLFFVAPVRRALMARAADYLVRTGRVQAHGAAGPGRRGPGGQGPGGQGTGGQGTGSAANGPVIDADYTDVTPDGDASRKTGPGEPADPNKMDEPGR